MKTVTIIGAGIAGLCASIRLAEEGIKVRLISQMPSERAQSVLAEGGINASLDLMGEGDTPEEHYKDTMRGGVWLANPNAVDRLTKGAPGIVTRLSKLGVPFHMENGRMVQRNFGGQKKKRTAFVKSSTGKAIMTALIDEARRFESTGLIRRYPHHVFLRAETAGTGEKRCLTGVRIKDLYTEKELFLPGPAIAAFGGFNGLFPGSTTGTALNTGNALAALFSQGVKIANPEFLQYHPTTVGIDGKRLLVSEAARGEGGRLFILRDGKPWYFMEELSPELKNLAPRDVISREMTKVLTDAPKGTHAFLDLRGLPGQVFAKRLSDLRDEIRHYLGIDPLKEPIPVAPGIHYFMGGLWTDEQLRTSLRGLFAAGECACQYHGANRLGGNSLLGAAFGGRTAAESVIAYLKEDRTEPSVIPLQPDQRTGEEEILSESHKETDLVRPSVSEELGHILMEGLPVLRNEAGLKRAVQKTDKLLHKALTPMERKRALLGKAILLCALMRKESRGAHTRTDYPGRDDDAFQKTTTAVLSGEEIIITFERIPERRQE